MKYNVLFLHHVSTISLVALFLKKKVFNMEFIVWKYLLLDQPPMWISLVKYILNQSPTHLLANAQIMKCMWSL